MAQDSNSTPATAEARAIAIQTLAVEQIVRSHPLRVFVRQFLDHCSILFPASVFDPDPVQNAYNQGIQAAGMEFARRLHEVSPQLIPALQLEEEEDVPDITDE